MVYLEIDKLKSHKDNPRKIAFRQLEKLCESIKRNPEYFEARPIICNSEYVIYAGNSRYKAALKLGLKKVPVHVMDLPDDKMREIMIRDNVNNGEWDTNLLADDWDVDLLNDFGIEFKTNFNGEQGDEYDGVAKQEGKNRKKIKAKKIVTCPHCNHDIEV